MDFKATIMKKIILFAFLVISLAGFGQVIQPGSPDVDIDVTATATNAEALRGLDTNNAAANYIPTNIDLTSRLALKVSVGATTPHATLSSALTQGVVSATVAYPLLFESTEDESSLYRQSGSFTCNLASPVTITWAAHKLAIGAAVVFSGLTGATGITAGTVYYVATSNFAVGSFELSTTFNATGNVNTSATGSGTVTCVSRIYAAEAGDYLFQVSAVTNTSDGSDATMDLWFVKGNLTTDLTGTNIAKSNTQCRILSTSEIIVAVPIILDLSAGDFIRLDYRGSTNKAQWRAIGTQTNPTRPAMPSVILTVNEVSK
jgi:hypothetical protein